MSECPVVLVASLVSRGGADLGRFGLRPSSTPPNPHLRLHSGLSVSGQDGGRCRSKPGHPAQVLVRVFSPGTDAEKPSGLTGAEAGEFRKDKKVGEGTYAVVYLGEHTQTLTSVSSGVC